MSIRSFESGAAAAAEGVRAARAERLPDVGVTVSASFLGDGRLWARSFGEGMKVDIPHFGNNFALEAQQVVYAGGAVRSGIRMAELEQRDAETSLERNRQDICFLLLGHYLNLYKADNRIRVLRENLALTEQVLETMRARREQGTVLQNDITRYELRREQLRLELQRAEDTGTILNHRLVTALHLPEDCPAFDLSAGCTGFLYAMETAASMIQSGRHKKIIIVGADKMSSMVNYSDRATCPIFGDGAAACMVEAPTEDYGIMDSILRTDGKGLPFLHMKAGGSVCPPSYFTIDNKMHYLYQEGRTVFKYAVSNMSDVTEQIAMRNGLDKDNIDWIVPHQANLRIIDAVASRLNVPIEKVMLNIQRYGNTSAGTLPLCLWDYEKQLKKGDNIIFTAFGAGFTWGAAYVKWGYDGNK